MARSLLSIRVMLLTTEWAPGSKNSETTDCMAIATRADSTLASRCKPSARWGCRVDGPPGCQTQHQGREQEPRIPLFPFPNGSR